MVNVIKQSGDKQIPILMRNVETNEYNLNIKD